MTANKILGKLIGRILEKMPLSLIVKLADGKLTKAELELLKDELVMVVTGVLSEIVVVEK